MHLCLEGEFKRKMKYHIHIYPYSMENHISDQDLHIINRKLSSLQLPHDFHKKVGLMHRKTFQKCKAGELQLYLLHLILPILKDILPHEYFCHMGLFVTAMHLLNQGTTTTTDINLAKILIEHYQRINHLLFGDRADTFTVHALRHLPDQIHHHGANLVVMSNFVFEGFIATFKRQYHGSRGIVAQMV